jgi:hypothetical protein
MRFIEWLRSPIEMPVYWVVFLTIMTICVAIQLWSEVF